MKHERLHLVDGTFELYRAHFSQRPDIEAPNGASIKATVGFMASMLALIGDPDEAVTHIAVAFDNPIRSFRNDLFAGYKSDEGVPPELRAQFDIVEKAARALGLVVWSMKQHEADDALATAARRFEGDFEQIRILSPDKDLGQCLHGRHVIQIDRIRKKEIDEDALVTARGIPPASIPDLLALTGDPQDGIPGLSGIGQKTATALLARYGHIEDIPPDPRTWAIKIRGAERIAKALTDHREEALFYRRLATLVTDVPLPETVEDLSYRGVRRRAFLELCAELGANNLAARPKRWDHSG